ncbi:MAG TPA: hypothetical protein VGB98_00185 [Pyrinomonadaceae bacterium]|jgi:hypothetical protein
MEVGKFIPPSDPENQAPDEGPGRATRHDYTVKVFAACPTRDASNARTLLGRVRIRPGPVAPGHTAAVRTPGGYLTLRRIYYVRVDAREYVCLKSLRADAPALRYPLGDVTILGTLVCISLAGEYCPECEGEG